MKAIKLFSALFVVLMLSASCTSEEPKMEVISFAEVKNYFCKNDVPEGEKLLKLTNQADFDHFFGSATVMGMDGKPTDIDFSKDIVIAKILPETNKSTEFTNISLDVPKANVMNLNYRTLSTKYLSYKIRPVLIIAVDRAYANCELAGADS